MKKLLFLAITIIFLPSIVMAGDLTFSIEQERVFNRKMVYESGEHQKTHGDSSESGNYILEGDSIANSKMDASKTFLKASYAVHPKVNVSAKLGSATADYSHDYIYPDKVEKESFESQSGFAWGAGVDVALMETNLARINLSGEYAAYEADGVVKVDGTDISNFVSHYISSTKVREWNIALKATTAIGRLSPFAGIRYSDVSLENEISGGGEEYSFHVAQKISAEKNVGIILGTSIAITDSLSVNIEGRAIDETALNTGIAYRF